MLNGYRCLWLSIAGRKAKGMTRGKHLNAEVFMRCPMSVVWSVFFYTLRRLKDSTVTIQLLQAPKTDGGNRVGGKNLSRFGSIGLIYEVSGYGGLGTVEDVENIKLYDFYHYLSFIRTSNAKD